MYLYANQFDFEKRVFCTDFASMGIRKTASRRVIISIVDKNGLEYWDRSVSVRNEGPLREGKNKNEP